MHPSADSLQALRRRLNPLSLQGAGFVTSLACGSPREDRSLGLDNASLSCRATALFSQWTGRERKKNYNSLSASQERGGWGLGRGCCERLLGQPPRLQALRLMCGVCLHTANQTTPSSGFPVTFTHMLERWEGEILIQL